MTSIISGNCNSDTIVPFTSRSKSPICTVPNASAFPPGATEEIMAPEENDILNDESQLERDVIAAFGKMGGANFDDRAFIVDEDSMAVPGTFHADGEGEYGPRDQLSGLVSEEFSASGRMLGLPRSWS